MERNSGRCADDDALLDTRAQRPCQCTTPPRQTRNDSKRAVATVARVKSDGGRDHATAKRDPRQKRSDCNFAIATVALQEYTAMEGETLSEQNATHGKRVATATLP